MNCSIILNCLGAVTHEEVVKVAKNASARWLDLGIELNIEVDTLEVSHFFNVHST